VFRNSFNPGFEKKFHAKWWEYPDDYEDNLWLENLGKMGPNGPCHFYLSLMKDSLWYRRKQNFEIDISCWLLAIAYCPHPLYSTEISVFKDNLGKF
jgi:hypothetical protein